MRSPVLVVLGATGTGKTKLSLQLAELLRTRMRQGQTHVDVSQPTQVEIINADSMQVYKGLDIVTAKATPEERAAVPHHLIDFLQPHQLFSVIDYRNMAVKIIDELLQQNKIPMIVGGTNYYVESLLWKVLVPEVQDDTSALISERDDSSVMAKLKDFDNPDLTNEYLHQKLKEVDPEKAEQLHPNNRRRVLRSLQVWLQTGRKHSEVLEEQRAQEGGCGLGGPLRYKDALILWLCCQQDIHDKRLEDRVDSMISEGLLQELNNFHENYNRTRAPDYTKGIFQSIGFKEFHDYLMLSEEDKKSPKGENLLAIGIENMKIATKQYARRQFKMTKNRLLGHPNRQMVPVYKLDTSDLNKWNENVRDVAVEIIDSHIQNKAPPIEPERFSVGLNYSDGINPNVTHVCQVCQRTFIGDFQYGIHLKSRRHQKVARKMNREGTKAERLVSSDGGSSL